MRIKFEDSKLFYANEISNITKEEICILMKRSIDFLRNYFNRLINNPLSNKYCIAINKIKNKRVLKIMAEHINDLLKEE